MEKDKWIWTDALAIEFLNFRMKYAGGFPHKTALEHFKESKLKEEDKRIVVERSTINFDKQILNPHRTGTQAYTNWEQGFLDAVNRYTKPADVKYNMGYN